VSEVCSEDIGVCSVYASTQLELCLQFPVSMRSTPSRTQVGGTNYYYAYGDGTNDGFDGWSGTGAMSKNRAMLFTNGDNFSGTQGQARRVRKQNASARLRFDAEL